MENSNSSQKKCVLYCRVSTKEQADEGNSLVTQERSGNEWARKNGYAIVRTFIERGESAKTADRPELQEMLRYCSGAKKIGVQSVVVYKIDRLARNTDDYREIRLLLRRYNVEIRSITEYFEDTPAGRFMENIIANVAQFDNDVRTERCVGGMKEAIREGRYVWSAPTGYSNVRVNGKATIAPNDMAYLVREAFELVARGADPIISVFHAMRHKGLTTNKGRVISKSNFHGLLRNPVYVGRIEKFGERYQGKYEPIVSEDIFEQVQGVLKGRGQSGRKYHLENPHFPLRRFVVDTAGRKLTGSFSRGRNAVYPFYRFNPDGANVRRDDFERLVAGKMDEYRFDENEFGVIKQKVTQQFVSTTTGRESAMDHFETRLSRLKGQESELVRKNLDGLINDELLKRELEQIDRAKFEIRNKLQYLQGDDNDLEEALDYVKDYLLSPGCFWLEAESPTRIGVQRFQFPKGLIFDGENFGTAEVGFVFREKSNLLAIKSCYVDSTELTWNRFITECRKLMEILRKSGTENPKTS